MSFLIKNENPLEGKKKKKKRSHDRLISLVPRGYARLRTWRALVGAAVAERPHPSSSPARNAKRRALLLDT